MEKATNMKPMPTYLIIKLFSRLPAKSVGRSILSGPDFIELFRLMFAVERKGSWSFFSSP
ncbi:unnamed protein product [Arabis nemorensis]|uniref:Uncharacterized protein n=1 Tax=Arabis nemorensis TaxID=586526 RepID=A0A565BWD0_9BRAS|nr:unnamed protein product [Arabis nemorensis]